MTVRSKGLLVLSVLLIAGGGGLAGVLQHDAADAFVTAQGTRAGEHARLRGVLTPSAAQWHGLQPAELGAAFSNHTYLLTLDEDTTSWTAVLVTSPTRLHGVSQTVVVDGDVLWSGPDPTTLGRTLVVVGNPTVDVPIFFR